MVNKENLKVGAEKANENDLRNRLVEIKKEIGQIGGPDKNDDKIEGIEDYLNGQFAEFLLKNENILVQLKREVDKIRNDWNLSSVAGPQLETLYIFLDDITNNERMKKDYDEFMKKIGDPKKLSTMKSWEIRRLNLYLGINKAEALNAYDKMKECVSNVKNQDGTTEIEYNPAKTEGMKSEDKSFFESVWNNLTINYSDSLDFIKADYPAVEGLKATVNSLKELAVENWNGNDEGLKVPEVKNSIVDVDKVNEIVRTKNQERINANREKVKAITINAEDLDNNLISKFTKTEDGVLKYEGNIFTVDKMMELLGVNIRESAKQGTEFVGDTERDAMINECKDDIFTNIKTVLLNRAINENSERIEDNDETSETIVGRTYEEGKENFKIKMSALKDRIKELKFYDGNEDGEKIIFNIEKVKGYLEGLKNKSWKELEHPADSLDRATWTIAVQIALNYLAKRDDKTNYNVHYIDGIRGNETERGVRAFQEANGLNFKNGQPDGLPGGVTITKLLEVLGGGSIDNKGSDVEGLDKNNN